MTLLAFLTTIGDAIFKFFKSISWALLLLAVLTIVSNNLPLTEIELYLTEFFSFVKTVIYSWDFVVNTDHLFTILGFSFYALVSYWLVLAFAFIFKMFDKSSN